MQPSVQKTGSQSSSDSDTILLIMATALALLFFIPVLQPFMTPIRYFVTYLHELGHTFASYLTGGGVDHIEMFQNGEGLTMTYGGSRFITLSAGYMGSTGFGAILLALGKRTAWARKGLYAFAVLMVFAAFMWVRPLIGFGFDIGIAMALGLFAAGKFLPGRAPAFLLQFLAVQCCLSSIWDIAILLRINSAGSRDNDAAFLAQYTHIPAIFWALTWGFGSLALLWFTIKILWQPSRVKAAV